MITLPFALNPALQALSSLDRFRVRAVIDWIDIEITTASPTNFMTVQDRLGAILDRERTRWVTPIDEGAGKAATRFEFAIHDLTDYRMLIRILERLGGAIPLVGQRVGSEIEVSIDHYSKRSDRAELEAMVMRLKHGLAVRGDKEIESGRSTQRVEGVRHLQTDTTLAIGDNGVGWRAYLKDIDNNKKPILDAAQHRARVEVTLPARLVLGGRDDLEVLRELRFETLAPWFPFRRLRPEDALATMSEKPTTAAVVVKQTLMDLALRRGPRELQVQSKRARRKHPKETRADTDLKGRTRDALRELTRRFRAGKPGKSSVTLVDYVGETIPVLITTSK